MTSSDDSRLGARTSEHGGSRQLPRMRRPTGPKRPRRHHSKPAIWSSSVLLRTVAEWFSDDSARSVRQGHL